ncbi:MAG: cyclic nucleotide-binding domain-containing protein [Taibaiella sp.]|nr:cyclic nucleotide-binding domain-containing protein [Taibaiella sp.]
MYAKLLSLLNQITILDDREEALVKESFKPFSIAKGAYFLEAGKINKHIGFINKGLVRYFVDKDGEEATFIFSKEGEFIADYQSFSQHKVTIQTIQAIEDCELLIIDYINVQHFFNTTRNGNFLGRIIIENRFDVMVNQLLSIYLHNQEERYKKIHRDLR